MFILDEQSECGRSYFSEWLLRSVRLGGVFSVLLLGCLWRKVYIHSAFTKCLFVRDTIGIKTDSLFYKEFKSLIKGENKGKKLYNTRAQRHWVKMGDTVVDGVDCATWWAQGRSVKKMRVLHSGQWESRDKGKKVWSSRAYSWNCNSQFESRLWGRHVQRWDEN